METQLPTAEEHGPGAAPDEGHDGSRAQAENGGDPVAAEAEGPGALTAILEGMLFAAGSPVPLARLADAVDGADRGEVRRALRALGRRLEADGRGLRLVEVAGGFQLRTLPEHAPYVRRLLGGRPPRLSRAMLETLAIIAYRQPCTRPEIEAIRGVDVDAVVSTLLERRMIRLLGRKEAPGRPLLYGTTREFLEVFGLPDLDALPPLRDLGEMAQVLSEVDLSVGEDGVHPTVLAQAETAAAAEQAPEDAPELHAGGDEISDGEDDPEPA